MHIHQAITMMKVLVLLFLATLCFSQSIYVGKHVTVRDDGVITIVGEQGREIDIYRNVFNPRKLNVLLKTPFGPSRKIEVDEVNNIRTLDLNTLDEAVLPTFENLGNAITQHEILVHLFGDYQGLIDADQYDRLMAKVYHLIKYGVLHKSIWDILRYFDQEYFAQRHQQWVSDYDKYVPRSEEYGISPYEKGLASQHGYSSEYFQTMTPVQRLYYLLQQHKYSQGHNEEVYPQQHYQQYNPEYQTIYEKLQHPYQQNQVNPWAKIFYNLNQRFTTGEQGQYPYHWQYQTPLAQEYVQGYIHQQQYPQGYSQWHSWQPQQWWYPQQYTRYQKEFIPEQWNVVQQHGLFGREPIVY